MFKFKYIILYYTVIERDKWMKKKHIKMPWTNDIIKILIVINKTIDWRTYIDIN